MAAETAGACASGPAGATVAGLVAEAAEGLQGDLNKEFQQMNTEKRISERRSFSAEVRYAYFNKKPFYSARALNLSSSGMCFRSSLFIKPGSTLYIRLEKFNPEVLKTGIWIGLRTVTLAEVKWCREVPGDGDTPYGIGVKYIEPVY